jgi:hypothetical protein
MNDKADCLARPFALDEGIAVLRRTPASLDALLRGLPDCWISAHEGPDTWTPLDVVAHLAHAERTNWIQRMHVIIEHGDARPFQEFDRHGHLETRGGRTIGDVLDEFAALRDHSLEELKAVAPADLDRRGAHPELGGVRLRQLLAAWVAHDLDHLVQIARVMARRYTDATGPWRNYLRVLRPER